MAGGGGAWSRRGCAQLRRLRTLVRDTQRALSDVAHIIHTESEVSATIQDIGMLANRSPALVILGRNPTSRVRLLHALLGINILPDDLPRGARWIRIQYGATLQVQLSLGNSDFELLEELHCSKTSWDTLPLEDLLRHDENDLTTVLDIEINNPFLKEGIKIVIPPDIKNLSSNDSMQTLKSNNTELFLKREFILKNFNPIFLYALDSIGRNIFIDNLREGSVESDEHIWYKNLYYLNRDSGESNNSDRKYFGPDCEHPCVFSAENCLDLQQAKELSDNCHVLFVLFANSKDICDYNLRDEKSGEEIKSDIVTEGIEHKTENTVVLGDKHQMGTESQTDLFGEQVAFLSDLVDQWNLISNPSPLKEVTQKWLIIDEEEISKNPTQPQISFLIPNPTINHNNPQKSPEISPTKGANSDRVMIHRQILLNKVLKFATESIQCYVLDFSRKLSEIHVKLTQQFIFASFDLARELQVVPKKIQYVVEQEQTLYDTINEKFSEGEKKRELVEIMQQVLTEMKTDVNHMDWSVDDLPCHQDKKYHATNTFPPTTSHVDTLRISIQNEGHEIEPAQSYDNYNFDDYVIINSTESSTPYNYELPDSIDTNSIRIENESDILSVDSSIVRFGSRLLGSATERPSLECRGTQLSVKNASLDVQRTVLAKLSNKISIRLVQFVDCLRDSYFGTLQRCLESLEMTCREELGGRPATEAMRQVLSVARQVDLQSCATFPVLRTLIESLRRLFHRLRWVGGAEQTRTCCVLAPTWRRHVALHTVHSLSAHRLAKIISLQIVERLSVAHERYQSALGSVQDALAGRLHHTEDVKLAIRKKYAPGFARLSLESASLCDVLQYGMPDLGREIGRGQYGVVFACKGPWGGHEPCCVKSVLPSDDRHFNELAMEFFYTRSIPPHPRIVSVWGSVVSGAGVLLVCERRTRDLHSAVRHGLRFHTRMAIARDIVDGIRYLHSLGLVHRDIKLQNVLLDSECRAALADLGFCASRALLCGSLVGTPAHMAPELIHGQYDAAVDVYAFGILFWYICAGNIKLPAAFEAFQNKEDLWTKVQKGLRPERLSHFPDPCWDIMQRCWHPLPAARALLGDVQRDLDQILANIHLYTHLDDITPPRPHGSCDFLDRDD